MKELIVMATTVNIKREIHELVNELPENKLLVIYDFLNYLVEKRLTDEDFFTKREKQRILNNLREACQDVKEQEAGLQSEDTLEEFISEFSNYSN